MIFRAGVGLVATTGNPTLQLNAVIAMPGNRRQLPEEKTIQDVPFAGGRPAQPTATSRNSGRRKCDLPDGRGQRYGGVVGRMTLPASGGRRMASMFSLTSGRPFRAYSSLAGRTAHTRQDGAPLTDPGTGFVFYFDAPRRRQFSKPGASTMFVNFDASFSKHLTPGEKHIVEIHAGSTNTPVRMGGRI